MSYANGGSVKSRLFSGGGNEGNEDIRTGDCNSDASDEGDDATCTRPKQCTQHKKDLVKAGTRSGIIRPNKSTVGDVKRWLGLLDLRAPSTYLGCKLKGATWGKSFKRPKLVVYSRKKNPKVKTATFGKRVLDSETQGTLKPHTGKGPSHW